MESITIASVDDKQIVGWGTGSFFFETVVVEERCLISFLVDRDPRKWGKTVAGIPVYAPEKLKELDPGKTQIIVFSSFLDEIAPRILAYGHAHYASGKDWIKIQLEGIEKALQDSKDHAATSRLHYRRAELLRRAGLHWQVVGSLEKAVALCSIDPQWHWELGQAYEVMQRYEDAAASYQSAIQLATNVSAQWYYRLGLVLELVGCQDTAIDSYAKAVARHPSAIARVYGVSFFHYASGELAKAIVALQLQIEKNGAPFLWFKLGKTYERMFQWCEAAVAYRQALAGDAGHSCCWYRLGMMCERMGQWGAAADAYDKAVSFRGGRRTSWLYRLGTVLFRQGEYEKACGVLGQAVPVKYHGVRIPEQWMDASVTDLELLVDADAVSSDLWYALGGAYAGSGNWQMAAEAYREAILRDNRQSPSGFYVLGQSLAKAGHLREACEAFLQTVVLGRPSLIPNRGKVEKRVRYQEYAETLPLEETTVLYEPCSGDSFSASFSALFQCAIRHPVCKDWRHVWVLTDTAKIPEGIRDLRHVIIVKRESPLYLRYLATAKYLVNNHVDFPTYFSRRKGQLYLSLPHDGLMACTCSPLRAGDVFGYKNIARNVLHVTHLGCTDSAAVHDFLMAYHVSGTFSGRILAVDRSLNSFFFGAGSENGQESKKGMSVLFCCQPFTPNGITTSQLNLLKALKAEKVRVTLLVDPNAVVSLPERMQKFNELPDYVEVLPRTGAINVSAEEDWVIKRLRTYHVLDGEAHWQVYGRAYKKEFVRVFGSAEFDTLIDFWGYSTVLSSLLAFAPKRQRRRAIFMHNTMDQEQRIKFPRLQAIFQMYHRFDVIVSVSEALLQRHRMTMGEKLGIPRDKFVFSRYAVDVHSIKTLAEEQIALPMSSAENRGKKHFVVVGRLSPEKGHPKLFKAFALVHERYPATCLWCLGDGPLRAELEEQIEALQLSGVVHMMGLVANPFPYMRVADCLVMSSDHEGQPLTLLEAMILGTPIIATRIEGVRELLEEHDYGCLVENSVDGLAEGMMAFLEGGMRTSSFDVEKYQSKALREFRTCVLGVDA